MWQFLLTVLVLHEPLVASVLNVPGCGLTPAFWSHRQPRERMSGSSRVVGGEPSPEGAWPWLVSLQLLHPGLGFVGHLCGGVLVHPQYVLTAAHCIHNERYHLPMAPLWSAEFSPGTRRVAVEDIFVHASYEGGYDHDIALVRLARRAAVTPVCLPPAGQLFLGVRCVASGWSGRPHNKASSDHGETGMLITRRQGTGPPGPRMHAHLTVVHAGTCRSLYASRYNVTLTAGHLCAGTSVRGTAGGGPMAGTCMGDSGGPLQCNMLDGRWYLAGITSFGSGCGRPGYPDVFTRLPYYLPWIRKHLREAEESNSNSL